MLLPRYVPRSPKQGVLPLLLLALTSWVVLRSPKVRSVQQHGHIDSAGAVEQLCRAHSFPPLLEDFRSRRVYDLLLLNAELDWLEVRLNSMYAYVDYFVIVESEKTFTGLPKPLSLRKNWSKFDAFHPKIIYVVVEDTVISDRAWDHEDQFRNALLYQAIPQVAGTESEPRMGDALLVSDIDEIPRPETIKVLRYCKFPDRLTLRSHFYYYSYQWLHRGEQWAHPQATTYRGIEQTISPTELRNGDGGPGFRLLRPLVRWWQKADLFDAAWHCSSCFATISEMQRKMASFSHKPWNTEENRNPSTIVDRVRNGKDLFNRPDQIYDKIQGNQNIPQYILDNWPRYRYMLNRDGEDAAFTDAKDFVQH